MGIGAAVAEVQVVRRVDGDFAREEAIDPFADRQRVDDMARTLSSAEDLPVSARFPSVSSGSIEIEARGTGGSDGAFGTWRNGSLAETESVLPGALGVDVDRDGAVPDGLPARLTRHHAGRLVLLTCQLARQSPHQLPKSETHGQEARGSGFNLGR